MLILQTLFLLIAIKTIYFVLQFAATTHNLPDIRELSTGNMVNLHRTLPYYITFPIAKTKDRIMD